MTQLFDAFISYGRADSRAFAQQLQARLQKQDFRVWFDFNDIPLAVDFQHQIDDGIEKADNFLFIISPHSVNSPYCLKEIELAVKLNKRIIPLLHVMEVSRETWQQRNRLGTDEEWEAYKAQGLHQSCPNMHPTIQKLNWVSFKEGTNDFEKSLADLISLLSSHTKYVRQHTQLLVKALEWERHQKQTSYLLVGEEKQQAKDWLRKRFKDEQPPCIPADLHCEYITESIKNGNNLMTKMFLSYADEDRATMEKICRSLRQEAITVWTNTRDIQPGEVFEEAIKRGIEKADNLVYLLSPDSVKSDYCRQELKLALSLNKRIIPVLVRATDLEEEIPALQDLQYIDLTDNIVEEDYKLDESDLLKIVRTDEAYYNEHKVLLVKALKWQEQQKNPSILLRGYNLRSADHWLKGAKTRKQHPPIPLQKEFVDESLRQPLLESVEVFISYSRTDGDFARKLNDTLQLQGKTTWFDQESIASGTDFQQEINRGIETCDNFLFVLSPRSVQSPYCADEVEYAASLNKRFVTVLHRPVETGDLHPELAKVQWIDFNGNRGDFNANFNQLVRTLDTDREHLRSHSKWLQRALEWEQKGKSDDLLLRGSEFAIARDWLQETEERQKKPGVTELQKAFIEASQKAIEAVEEEKKRRLLMLRLLLGLVTAALVGAFIQWQRADNLRQKATEAQILNLTRFSLIASQFDHKFGALLEALRAKRELQNLKTVEPEIKESVLTALQAAVYEVEKKYTERNQLTKHRDRVYGVAFSPDGKTIASASRDNTIKLWNAEGQLLHTLEEHKDVVEMVAFSPDGEIIASASRDKTVKLWNLKGQLLQTFEGHKDMVKSVAFSPDGKTIASASRDNTIKLWNLESKEVRTFVGHEDGVRDVAFSPDGKTIASASWDKTVKLWSLEGEERQTLRGHEDRVQGVAFSPDGQTIASAGRDKTIKLWSLQGELLKTLAGHEDKVRSVAFSPDGQTIASASWDKTIKLWSLQGELRQILVGHKNGVYSAAFSPDGKTIASASLDKTLKLWSRESQRLKTLKGHTDWAFGVAFSPDGQTLASASDDRTVKLWNLESGEVQTLEGHKGWVRGVALSPDGKTIASASRDETVKLWNAEGQLLRTLTGHKDGVISVTFSPDGKTIASASRDKTVKLRNLQGELLQTLEGHEDWVRAVAFSPDGQTIASASLDKTVKLWNAEGQLLHALTGHEDGVYSVAFSPDGKTIASGSWDKTVKLWNLKGKELRTFVGHKDKVRSVAFSPDGKTIASASDDKTVKLWNLEGQELHTLVGHKDIALTVAFAPQGDRNGPKSLRIASGGADNVVILWNLADINLDSLVEDACDWVGDYLKHNAPEDDRDLCF